MPHVIRLRGPWSWERNGDCDKGTRRFGRPTLPEGERVWLVIESAWAIEEVRLNDAPLAGDLSQRGWRCDVTTSLAWRNELSLRLASAPADTNVEVRLEID